MARQNGAAPGDSMLRLGPALAGAVMVGLAVHEQSWSVVAALVVFSLLFSLLLGAQLIAKAIRDTRNPW